VFVESTHRVQGEQHVHGTLGAGLLVGIIQMDSGRPQQRQNVWVVQPPHDLCLLLGRRQLLASHRKHLDASFARQAQRVTAKAVGRRARRAKLTGFPGITNLVAEAVKGQSTALGEGSSAQSHLLQCVFSTVQHSFVVGGGNLFHYIHKGVAALAQLQRAH
jgi:hypothetical protein